MEHRINIPCGLNADEDHDRLIETVADKGRENFEQDGFVASVLFAPDPDRTKDKVTDKPRLFVIALPPLDDGFKEELAGVIAGLSSKVPTLLIVEAWLIKHDKDKVNPDGSKSMQEAVKGLPAPRDDPNRTECVVLQYFHKERRVVWMAEIARPKDGEPTMGEWSEPVDSVEKEISGCKCDSKGIEVVDD